MDSWVYAYSQHVQFYPLNMCGVLYIHYTSVSLLSFLKKGKQKNLQVVEEEREKRVGKALSVEPRAGLVCRPPGGRAQQSDRLELGNHP